MAYKDKEKQKWAQRNWVRQKRAAKSSTEQGSTSITADDVTQKPSVTFPKNYGQTDCECRHCQVTKTGREQGRIIINHGPYKPIHKLGLHEWNRVSLPGDVDYHSVPQGQVVHLSGGR